MLNRAVLPSPHDASKEQPPIVLLFILLSLAISLTLSSGSVLGFACLVHSVEIHIGLAHGESDPRITCPVDPAYHP